MLSPATGESLGELLGPPYDISSAEQTLSRSSLSEAAFELYKEAATVTMIVANLYVGESEEATLDRNHAIDAALVVRIAKLMSSVLQLCSRNIHGTGVLVLERSIIESCITLRYLLNSGKHEVYNDFVRFSLGPERELFDTLSANIARRKTSLPIEDRMMKSLERVFRLSEVQVDELETRYPKWEKGLHNQLKTLGLADMYLFIQRIPSHAVHGSWVDLLLHHIEEAKGGFRVNPEPTRIDPRQLCPIAIIVLGTCSSYLKTHYSSFAEVAELLARIDDLTSRLETVDKLHERLLSSS